MRLVKSTPEIEHLNLDNVLKSTIFTGSKFHSIYDSFAKKFSLVCETVRFVI